MAAAAAAQTTWKPHSSLTTAPTNLKEAIDWVLRVTGRDGKKNVAAKPPANTSNGPHCLCYLAKAVKDLLYDARCPGSPGPSPDRYWDGILLEQESDIVNPVLTDLGLVHSGSTSAASSTCAGGTEVIGTLIDQLALGLQKWVGWQDKRDECCLKGDSGGVSKGIGKKCDCSGVGTCCSPGGPSTTCQCATGADKKCYLSAYCKTKSTSGGASQSDGDSYWPTISSDCTKVHLLARIFLGSVCLIWSGLSQLGFLTGGSGSDRWSKEGKLHEEGKGLGSFMAAMGYDLERLNGSGVPGPGKKGEIVWNLLSGQEPSDEKKKIKWQEFSSVKGANQESVAEYYSSIYDKAKGAAKGSTTEKLCQDYPLLVLHILASGYFRAGSAGAKGITSPAKPASSDPKKDTTHRKPRTIREILYWLSALPYSQGYCQLVERMGDKFPEDEQKKGQLQLHGEGDKTTDLKRDDITHYLMAACGYCPLVLIGIQGTIEREVDNAGTQASGPGGAGADQNKCPEHSKDRSKRCTYKEETADQPSAAPGAPAASAPSTGQPLGKGQVCYGGYHLEVSSFGPLHGMYANGLFGFQMDMSSAQCLDQLRIYVYHCFYQLYFLRKQCSTGVEVGGASGSGVAVGWSSCRYGKGVSWCGGYSRNEKWLCEGGSNDKCKCKEIASHSSPLMYFLCDGLGPLVCGVTVGKTPDSEDNPYPEINDHVESKNDIGLKHFEAPQLCPVPMGWSAESGKGTTQDRVNHFKDLNTGSHKTLQLTGVSGSGATHYPAHCTGNTLALLLEYYCDPEKPHGTLVVLLRLLACITPTVPRTLGDLFGFYYYIVYIGGNQGGGQKEVNTALGELEREVVLYMGKDNKVVEALTTWNNSGKCSTGNEKNLKCLYKCPNSGTGQCCQYLSPLSGQQYGQLSPAMAGTYLSWLVYLIEKFETGLKGLAKDYRDIACRDDCNTGAPGGACGPGCGKGTHGTTCNPGSSGDQGVCKCPSVVSCTGVLPVLYKYGFGYGNVKALHKTGGQKKQCHDFLGTLTNVEKSTEFKKLTTSINQLIYTTRLPWIFVLTIAWLVAVLYLAFGAIWPLDWTHMRSHCRGWFRKGSLSPWEVLMVGKKKGRGILEYFGTGSAQKKQCHHFLKTLTKDLEGDHLKTGITAKGLHHEINQLIYTTRLPWIFVLTLAWLMAVLYLAFGAIWPLDWTHMRSHCRGWFRKGSLSPWEVLMVGKKKGRGILEFFGGR